MLILTNLSMRNRKMQQTIEAMVKILGEMRQRWLIVIIISVLSQYNNQKLKNCTNSEWLFKVYLQFCWTVWKLEKFPGPLVAHHNEKSSCLSQQNVHQYGYLQVGLFISLPPPINLFKSRDFITIIDFATNVTVWERVEGEAIIPASLENIEVTYLHTTASYFWPPNILLGWSKT